MLYLGGVCRICTPLFQSKRIMKNKTVLPDESQILSRKDCQEILLARMAAGDLYANELRLKIRKADMLFDRLRDKPIYSSNEKGNGQKRDATKMA